MSENPTLTQPIPIMLPPPPTYHLTEKLKSWILCSFACLPKVPILKNKKNQVMPKSYQSTSCLMTSSTCSLLGLPLPLFWRGNWRLFGTPSSLSGWSRVSTGSTYFGDRAFCLWHWGHILLLLFASHLKFLHLNIFFIFIFFSVRAFWIRFCSKTTSPKKVLKEPNRTKC